MNEIEAIIKQTFGCEKEKLTEKDLEMIMNTKVLITNGCHVDDHEQSHRDSSLYAVPIRYGNSDR